MKNDSDLTRTQNYIKETLPWVNGHQLKSLSTFVSAILDEQTGNQAQLARTQGNQEAACKRRNRNSFDFGERPDFEAATVTKIKISPGTPIGTYVAAPITE